MGLTPNTAYTLTGWVRTDGGATFLGAKQYNAAGDVADALTTNTGWTPLTDYFTTGATGTSVDIYCYRPTPGTSTCDDITLTATPGSVADSGFETGLLEAGWVASHDAHITTIDPHSGTYAGQIDATDASGNGAIEQVVTGLTPNTPYTLTGWVRTDGGATFLGAKQYNAAGSTTDASTTATGWTQLTDYFTTGATGTSVDIYCYRPSVGTSACDDITLTATPAKVADPGFETGLLEEGWEPSHDAHVTTTNPHSGSYAGQITATPAGGDGAIEQVVKGLTPNTPYTLTGWVRTDGGATFLGAKQYDAAGAVADASTTATGWTQLTDYFTTGATGTSVDIYCYRPTPGTSACDDITLTATPGKVADSGFEAGLLEAGWGPSHDAHITTTNPHSGTYAGQITATPAGGDGAIEQVVKGLIPNTPYTLTGWVRTDGGATFLGAKQYDTTGDNTDTSTTATGWTQLTEYFITGATGTSVDIYCYRPTPGTSACDDITLTPRYTGTWPLHAPVEEQGRETQCLSAQRLQMGGPAIQAAMAGVLSSSGKGGDPAQAVRNDAAQQASWDNSQDLLRRSYQSMLGNLPLPQPPGTNRPDSFGIDWTNGGTVPWAQIPDYNASVRTFLDQRAAKETNPTSYADLVVPADQAALNKAKAIIASSTDPLLSTPGGLRDQIANPAAGHYATDAADIADFLTIGGFAQTAPTPGSLEFRTGVEAIKARWAACTSSNPWDPHQVLGAEVATASTEWQAELASQATQRNDIITAANAAAIDLQKANDAMADAMAQAYIEQRILVIERFVMAHSTEGPPPPNTSCTWSTCTADGASWVRPIGNRICEAGLQYWCDLIGTLNEDNQSIGMSISSDLNAAYKAQLDAAAQADKVTAAEAAAGNISKANNYPYDRGLSYALQAAQVTKASAAAAAAASQAGESARRAAMAGAADAMALWALSDTRAHAVKAEFARAAAEEAAAQAHAAAGAAAAQSTAAAASAKAVHDDRVTAEAALATAKAKAAIAKAKRADADTQAGTAAAAAADAATHQSEAAQAEATAKTQQDAATKAHQDADTAAAQATARQNDAEAAEKKAADDRYTAQQAQAAKDATKAQADAWDAQAQALVGTTAAVMAKDSANQADAAAATAATAAAAAQSAADASTTAAQAARADATRAAGAAAKAKSDAAAADSAAAGSRSSAATAHAAAADAIANAAAAANNVAQATTDAAAAQKDADTAAKQATTAASEADMAQASANRAAGYATASADYATGARDAAHAVVISASQAVQYGAPYQRSDATAGLAILVAQNSSNLAAQQDAAAAASAAEAAKAATDAHNLAVQASADAKAAATAADNAASDALAAQNSLVATRASAKAAADDAAATTAADKAAASAASSATADASAAGKDASSAAAAATAAANSASAAEQNAAGAHSAANDASAQAAAAQAAAKTAQDAASAAAAAATRAAADAADAERAAMAAEAQARADAEAEEDALDDRYAADLAASGQKDVADLLAQIPPDRMKVLQADIQNYLKNDPNFFDNPNNYSIVMVRVRWAIDGNLNLTAIWDENKGAAVGLLVTAVGLALCPETAGATCAIAVGALSGAATACVEDCSDVRNIALQAVVSAALMGGGGKVAEVLASTIAKRIADDELATFLSSCIRPHSFAAGTEVRMANGTAKPIQDIRVGDEVENAVPGATGAELHRIDQVHTTYSDTDFTDLTLETPEGQSTITGTQNHPYYDLSVEAFVDASKLSVGDKLQSTSGSVVTVVAVRNYTGSMVTYDLTVDGLHTYFVEAGHTPILVHNDSCRDAIFAKLPVRPNNEGATSGIAVTDAGVELPMVDSTVSGDPSYQVLARRVSDRLRQWNLLPPGTAISKRAYDVEQTVAAMMLDENGATTIKGVNLVINNSDGPCIVRLGCNMALPYILNDDQVIVIHWKDAAGVWRNKAYRGLNKKG